MKTTIYDNLEIPQRLENYFAKLDSYDQPYFTLLKFDAEAKFAEELAQEAVRSEDEDDIYGCGSLIIAEDLVFLAIDTKSEIIKSIANRFVSLFEEDDIKVNISIFCHNCLGEAKETFRWCAYQLDEAIETSTILINDFTDKANWQGIEKYRKFDKA